MMKEHEKGGLPGDFVPVQPKERTNRTPVRVPAGAVPSG